MTRFHFLRSICNFIEFSFFSLFLEIMKKNFKDSLDISFAVVSSFAKILQFLPSISTVVQYSKFMIVFFYFIVCKSVLLTV